MTNILHIMSTLELGGAERLLLDFLRASKKVPDEFNYSVVVVNNLVDKDLAAEFLDTGYNIYFLNKKEGDKNPKYFFELLKIIHQDKIQIIHTHNYGGKMRAIAAKILQPALKLVFTIHDVNIVNKLNPVKLFFHKNYIDYNISITKAVQNDCAAVNLTKSGVIYNGIDLSPFKNLTPKKNNNVFNIVIVSRITHKKKGQDILIKAVSILAEKGIELKCRIIGKNYDYDKESPIYLNQLVAKLHLQKQVEFLKNVEYIVPYLQQADVFVLPSRYEGLGLVVLESMASGTPVIVSNIDGPAELVQDGVNGLLFESENHVELADRLIDLYEDRAKRAKLAKNGLEFVKNFDIVNMYRGYCQVYNELLKPHG